MLSNLPLLAVIGVAPFVSFGLTMWVTALVYSAVHVLCKKDIAPSP